MSEQPTLFSRPPAQAHSVTSRDAADMIRPAATTIRGQVFDWIVTYGPVTDEQISDGLEMNPSTVRPRRIELHRAGMIGPHPVVGRTKSGRSAVRWVAIESEQP